MLVKLVLNDSPREDSCFLVDDDLVVVQIALLLPPRRSTMHRVVAVWRFALQFVEVRLGLQDPTPGNLTEEHLTGVV
eukprot:COSAG02_NODE_26716_length_626_cov_1.172676_2_plen_76_part_01